MRTSTKSALQTLIIAEVARQTGKRKLNEVAVTKFEKGQVVMVVGGGDESKQPIEAVYKNVGAALFDAIRNREADDLTQVAVRIAASPALAALPCYKLKNGYYYIEMDLKSNPSV